MDTVSPRSFPAGLVEALKEILGEDPPPSFLLSGGLSGAQIYLIPFQSAPYVIKVGPSELIQREQENFGKLNGTAAHSQVSCDPAIAAKIEGRILPFEQRMIAYRFAGKIPAQTDHLLDFLDCAELFLNGQSEEFLSQIAMVQQSLLDFWFRSAQPTGEIVRLPDFLEPDWKRVEPLLATAESMSRAVVTRGEVRAAWKLWEEERLRPIRMRMGYIHGDLRCANIIISQGEPYLVDFGSVKKSLSFLDLVRLEIDIVLRARVPVAIREEMAKNIFNPSLWSPNASTQNPAQRLITAFRWGYIQTLPGQKTTTLARRDFYIAYMSELLQRTTYWEGLFLSEEIRHMIWWLLAHCVQHLQNVDQACAPPTEHFDDFDRLIHPPSIPEGIGLVRCYYGEKDNLERNQRKHDLLHGYNGIAVLLAHSGFSYLVPNAPHFQAVRSFLLNDPQNRFIAILTNPFCQAAIEIYLNWIRSYLRQNPGWKDGARLAQNYKLTSALQGYNNLKLKFGSQIEVRMTSFEPGCTVIWTSRGYFLEPYFKFDQFDRANNGLNTYEFECSTQSPFAESLQFSMDDKITHLNFFYQHSIPLEKWHQNRLLLIQSAEQNLEWLERTEEIDSFERSRISDHLQYYLNDL